MTTLDFPSTAFLSRDVARADRHGVDRHGVNRDGVNRDGVNRHGVAMVQLHDDLWRVTRTSGEVLGYIEAFPEAGDLRYRAKRKFAGSAAALQRRSMPLGEFWSIDDAVDCFRLA